MINLTDLLEGGAILPLIEAQSRKQALSQMASALEVNSKPSARDILELVMERERLGSTGVGQGVAIPHARVAELERPIGVYARLAQAVEFEAVDDRPCDLLFMLIAPETAGADHLRALAQVSRAFRQASVRDALREATTEDDVRAILCRAEASAVA